VIVGGSPGPEARATAQLDEQTVTPVRADDVELDGSTASLDAEASQREAAARARADRDLPRTSADVGDADFRSNSTARTISTQLTQTGFSAGASAVGSGLDAIGAEEGADRDVLTRIGGTIGATPGSAATTGVDVAQGAQSVVDASLRGGPSAAVTQSRDLTADAFDNTAAGVDRLFDVDRERRASGEGALIQVEDDARQDAAVAFTTGALSIPAGFAAGAGTRAIARRAPTSIDDVGRRLRGRPNRDRVASDGGFRAQDIEQETVTIEQMADETRTQTRDVEDIPGVSVENSDTPDIDADLKAQLQAVEEELDTADTGPASAQQRAANRLPPAEEFASQQARQQELDALTRRLRQEDLNAAAGSRVAGSIETLGAVGSMTAAATTPRGPVRGGREAEPTLAPVEPMTATGVAAGTADSDTQTDTEIVADASQDTGLVAGTTAASDQQSVVEVTQTVADATATTQATGIGADTVGTTSGTAVDVVETQLTRPTPRRAPDIDIDAPDPADDMDSFDTVTSFEDVEFETRTLDAVDADLTGEVFLPDGP